LKSLIKYKFYKSDQSREPSARRPNFELAQNLRIHRISQLDIFTFFIVVFEFKNELQWTLQ